MRRHHEQAQRRAFGVGATQANASEWVSCRPVGADARPRHRLPLAVGKFVGENGELPNARDGRMASHVTIIATARMGHEFGHGESMTPSGKRNSTARGGHWQARQTWADFAASKAVERIYLREQFARPGSPLPHPRRRLSSRVHGGHSGEGVCRHGRVLPPAIPLRALPSTAAIRSQNPRGAW